MTATLSGRQSKGCSSACIPGGCAKMIAPRHFTAARIVPKLCFLKARRLRRLLMQPYLQSWRANTSASLLKKEMPQKHNKKHQLCTTVQERGLELLLHDCCILLRQHFWCAVLGMAVVLDMSEGLANPQFTFARFWKNRPYCWGPLVCVEVVMIHIILRQLAWQDVLAPSQTQITCAFAGIFSL